MPTKFKAKLLDKKALKEVLKLEGRDYIYVMTALYNELNKDLERIDQERSELAQSIKSTVEARLRFIEEAWSDLELSREEKRKIYEDYLNTSTAFQQYLIDKENAATKLKNKKETIKTVTCCGTFFVATTIAVLTVASKVLSFTKH